MRWRWTRCSSALTHVKDRRGAVLSSMVNRWASDHHTTMRLSVHHRRRTMVRNRWHTTSTTWLMRDNVHLLLMLNWVRLLVLVLMLNAVLLLVGCIPVQLSRLMLLLLLLTKVLCTACTAQLLMRLLMLVLLLMLPRRGVSRHRSRGYTTHYRRLRPLLLMMMMVMISMLLLMGLILMLLGLRW